MNNPNTPCRNPKVCGVKSHRAGTSPRCATVPNRKVRSMKPGVIPEAGPNWADQPKLPPRSKPYPITEQGESVLHDILHGSEDVDIELPEGGAGERRFLILNTHKGYESGLRDELSYYLNRLESAKIITTSGLEVYGGTHKGGSLTRCYLSDGVVRSSKIIPLDRDGNVADSRMTSAEYDSLCDLDQTAEALGYTDPGSNTPELVQQEIVGKAVEMAKDGWTYTQKRDENGTRIN